MGRIKCLSYFKRYKQLSLSALVEPVIYDDNEYDTLSQFAYTYGGFSNIANVCAIKAKLSTAQLCVVSKSCKGGFINYRYIKYNYDTRKLSLFKYVETKPYGECRGGYR